jgi:hypothetical protein
MPVKKKSEQETWAEAAKLVGRLTERIASTSVEGLRPWSKWPPESLQGEWPLVIREIGELRVAVVPPDVYDVALAAADPKTPRLIGRVPDAAARYLHKLNGLPEDVTIVRGVEANTPRRREFPASTGLRRQLELQHEADIYALDLGYPGLRALSGSKQGRGSKGGQRSQISEGLKRHRARLITHLVEDRGASFREVGRVLDISHVAARTAYLKYGKPDREKAKAARLQEYIALDPARVDANTEDLRRRSDG